MTGDYPYDFCIDEVVLFSDSYVSVALVALVLGCISCFYITKCLLLILLSFSYMHL
jgi:hypothetical protein